MKKSSTSLCFSVVLVGAGELGSRYLQGLARIQFNLRINVVEPRLLAVAVAKQRLEEVLVNSSRCRVDWNEDIREIDSSVDLVIVSTSSFNRASLVEEIQLCLNPKFWIIEKVLAQSVPELDRLKIATSAAKGAWVNTPRRLMSWYFKCQRYFSSNLPLRVSKSGTTWGLACNAIHFIDLVSWWTGEVLITIDSTGLDSRWFESKRPGYYETTGTLVARYSGGSELRLTSQNSNDENFLKVDVVNGDSWLIDEGKGLARSSTGISINGRLEYQSELTVPLVEKILTSGTCGLPTLEESAVQHEVFLNGMLAHWNLSHNSYAQEVPIT